MIAAAVVAATAAHARAQAGDAAAPPPEPLAKVAVVILPASPDDKLTSARLATVQVSMEHALAADARLDVVDLDEGLADSGGVTPKDAVAEARAMIASGEALLRRGQYRAALLKLEGAASQLAGVLAWAKKEELARAEFLRGAAHAALGEDKAALDELTALAVWRPDFVADPTIVPRAVTLWEKAQARARRLAGGAVDVTSEPRGAMAYADGRFVGFTPTTVEALAVGTHYVTVRARGYQKAVIAVKITDKKPATAAVTLQPSPRAGDLDADVAKLRAGLGAAQAPADTQATLGEISDLLGVDQLVVLLAPPAGGTAYHAYVYSAVGGTRLAEAEAQVQDGAEGLDDALGRLTVDLYKQVSFAPPPPPPPPRAPRVAEKKPWWKQWWFWSGVGAGVLAVSAGALIVHERSGGPSCPGGDSCGIVVLSF